MSETKALYATAPAPEQALPRRVRLARYLGWTKIASTPNGRWFGTDPDGHGREIPLFDADDREAGPLLAELDRQEWDIEYFYRRRTDSTWSLTVSKRVHGVRVYGHGEGSTIAEAATNTALEAFERQARQQEAA